MKDLVSDIGKPRGFIHYSNAAQDVAIGGSKGRFVAFVSVLVTAVFAYLGSELVAVTFSETRNPRRAIPKAIKLTLYRILVFTSCRFYLLVCVSHLKIHYYWVLKVPMPELVLLLLPLKR